MKRISVFLSFLILFTLGGKVKAEEANFSYTRLNGIYYTATVNGTTHSINLPMFKMNGRTAYCIELGVQINEKVYDVYTDWSMVNFSDELKSLIEKIGYYGYDYPGHQTDYYYSATQELIWTAINKDVQINWSTGKNMTGQAIDLSKEKNEILSLVNKHELIPSFSNAEVKDYVGKEITLTDDNNVLDDYDISESSYHKVLKEGNKLIITLNKEKVDDEVLTLTRKHYDDAPLLIYSRGSSQKLAALRISTDKTVSIKISNEEQPEIVEVPDTGLFDISGYLGTLMTGVGIVLFKVH